ncbi:hypothetical protein MBLNU457_g3026t1 [Dothideomycetes sp. NU457]
MANQSAPSKMQAYQYTASSGPIERTLTLKNVAVPTPSSSQILIRTSAASLNPIDYKLAEAPLVSFLTRYFTTPGLDFSGHVVSGSSDLTPGTLVYGRLEPPAKYGALSPYLVVPRSGLAKLGSKVSAEEAAGLGTAAQTAYQSIVPFVREGQTVFINGASGGTGVFAVQIAKIVGCKVVATCSGANAQMVKDLGADEVVDYRSQNVLEALKARGEKVDHVVDAVGKSGELYFGAHHYLREGGVFAQFGAGVSLADTKDLMGKMLWPAMFGGGKRGFKFISVVNNKKDMEKIAEWYEEGKLKVVVDSTYSYDQAPQAFEKLKTGRAKGKVIVTAANRD